MVPLQGRRAEEALHEPWLVWSSAFRRLEKLGPAEAGTPYCQRLHGPNACGKDGRKLSMNLGSRDDLVAERRDECSRGFQPTVRRRTRVCRRVATVERRCPLQLFMRRHATPNRVIHCRPRVAVVAPKRRFDAPRRRKTRGYHHSFAPRSNGPHGKRRCHAPTLQRSNASTLLTIPDYFL